MLYFFSWFYFLILFPGYKYNSSNPKIRSRETMIFCFFKSLIMYDVGMLIFTTISHSNHIIIILNKCAIHCRLRTLLTAEKFYLIAARLSANPLLPQIICSLLVAECFQMGGVIWRVRSSLMIIIIKTPVLL